MPGTRSRALSVFSLVSFVFVVVGMVPAVAEPGDKQPISFSQPGLRSLGGISAWTSPSVDVPALLVEDVANADNFEIPYRIGFPMATELSSDNAGTWEILSGGDRLWRLRVESQGALWTVLGFDTFRLQYGASMWVYDVGGATVLGPFTGADINQEGQLWTVPVEGDRLVVELYWPAKLAGEMPRLHLGTVSHGYKPFGTIGAGGRSTNAFGDSGSCNIDVQCPLGTDWQDEKRGVVMMLSGGTGVCTASLINTTANDCRPYVLTAAHCGAGASTTFSFNFERPACSSGTPPPVSNQVSSAGVVLANFASSDFTLLRLNTPPPDTFDAYFNGWSRDPNPTTMTTVIHHPSADAKKISRDNDPPINGSNWGANHWRTQVYEQGTTEGGSSGSPLFDQNSRIIGQLHGGTASCTSLTYDEYGKVDASWTGGGAAASRLSDWLDPAPATGALTMNGVDWSTCAFNPVGEVTLNRDIYGCSDTLGIRVADDSIQGGGPITVEVVSNTETSPETVTLTETPAGSGIFLGSFPVASIPAVNGDGTLSVSAGDTVTVTYIDADDGAGGTNIARTDTGAIDCTGPVISNVQVSNVTGNSALVTWTTNEASNSVVRYGISAPPGSTASVATLVTSHSVLLTGLAPCQVHVVEVQSTDGAGNSATDNNGGAYYPFTTGVNNNPTYAATGLPTAIPDNAPAGITSVINITDVNTVLDVNVRVKVTHPFIADVDLFLIGPNGVQIELSTDNGGAGDDYNVTVFDDEAAGSITAAAPPYNGSFKPEVALSAYDGISAVGNWTLKVVDDLGADLGTLDTFELILTYPALACGTAVGYQSHTVADSCDSGGAGSANGVADPGERLSLPVRLANTGTSAATTVAATITSPTPGVSIVDGSAAYPNLPVNQSALGDAPFVVLLDPSVACGSLVTIDLAITSAQGAWSGSFTIRVGALVTSVSTFPSTDTPKPIPDLAVTTSTIVVASTDVITDVDVTFNATHTFDGDLDVFLIGPNGVRVELTSDNGSNGQNFVNTVFDDAAATSVTAGVAPFTGSFKPEGLLSTLNGIPANGNWTLEITDDTGVDVGTLNSWSIRLNAVTGYACTNCAPPAPGETTGLRWTASSLKDTLEWDPTAGAASYSLYRGTEATLPDLYTPAVDSCQVGTTAGTSYSGISTGSDFDWFLVRASNGGGQGPAGAGTGGSRLHDPSGVCP